MDWIETAAKLPESGRKVIAYYENANGKPRRIMAFYAPQYDIESSIDDDHEAYEYCEAKDTYYLVEGWYENNEFDEVNWRVYGEITHWMPLPDPPQPRRVKLIKQDVPDSALPIGSEGMVVAGTLETPGMVRVLFDNGMNIPMYRNELESI